MKEINVHIGEVKIAKQGEVLKAILGSCVGIGLIWKSKNICGLAHCLLPEAEQQSFIISGRFVNQAIPSMMVLMKIRPENINEIEAVIAGGGNMTSAIDTDPSELVGSANFKVAMAELKKFGIRLVYSESGGQEGRKIFINNADCTYRVEKIPRFGTAV